MIGKNKLINNKKEMKFKLFTVTFFTGITFFAAAQKAIVKNKTTSKPNIIFFLIDDMGWMDAGFNGSTFYETPNIDKLAKEGMKFSNAYAACPVCSPTRASIMTGKYPAGMKNTDWFGAPQPEAAAKDKNWSKKKLLPASYIENLALEEVTIAEALKTNGYKTFIAGKWHLGQNEKYWPENQGFEINKGGYSKGHPGNYFSPYNNPRLTDGPVGEYLGDRVAAETVNFIEANKQKSFFAYVPFYEVHTPMQAKDSLIKKYELKKERLGLKDEFITRTDGKKTRTSQALPVYAAMVESMDNAVGQILNKIKQAGLEKNTIIVFFSDNGGLSTSEGTPTSNLPLRGGKGWLYEGGIREPAIIKYPLQIKAGTVSNVPIISNDFYPTLLQMAGLPLIPKQHTGGISITPIFKDNSLQREALYWHYPHYGNQGGSPGAAIRMGKWKLIEWYENNTIELFDLEKDMAEQNNVANANVAIKNKLLTMLHNWQKKENAEMPTVNPNANKEGKTEVGTANNMDTAYLSNVINELKKKWPKNRIINLVFHGHSVVAGYASTPNIITFQSYPMLVLQKVTEKYSTVPVNCIRTAIGGENSEQGEKRFDSTVLNHQPDVLFIDYAVNDRYIGIERAQAAWEAMIKRALAKNIKTILLTPTPDLNEDIKSDDAPLQKHNSMIIALAKKYNLPVIDSYQIFKKMALAGVDLKQYMAQNNHPNEKGHQLVAAEICKLFAAQ
jgi:arylsulfatase A-like enzyme/lysophospholipase L1-like esterase